MSNVPTFQLDLAAFHSNPYPQLSQLRKDAPIAFIPGLNWYMMTKYEDIFENEKRVDIFSSAAPGSRMEKTVGVSMMLKDGKAHMAERTAINPTLRYGTMKKYWNDKFLKIVDDAIDSFIDQKSGELYTLLSMSIAADVLKELTGFREVSRKEIIDLSAGLIVGITNFQNTAEIVHLSKAASDRIDEYIEKAKPSMMDPSDRSILSVLVKKGFNDEQLQANMKLIISGGLNEPRSGLAGTVGALLSHPKELAKCQSGEETWRKAFEEFGRWQSPIGMGLRTVTKAHTVRGITFQPGDSVSLVWRSGNRDDDIFEHPNQFNVSRTNLSKAMTFGAGPHFCAGSWASKALIGDVALERIFARLKNLRLAPDAKVVYDGMVFRHPVVVSCVWD